jgi:hypothetical protein
MSRNDGLDPESSDFNARPNFCLGQHESSRVETLPDGQYRQVLASGVSPPCHISNLKTLTYIEK